MECAPLLPGAPEPRRVGGGNVAQRSRARCARVFRQHADVLSKSPAARSRTRRTGCPKGADPGCVSFGYLSFRKRKVTRPQDGGRNSRRMRATRS